MPKRKRVSTSARRAPLKRRKTAPARARRSARPAWGRAGRGRAKGYAPSTFTTRYKVAPQQNDWANSILDPCNVRGVKVPDGHIFPTATDQIKLHFNASQTTAVNGFSITPSDIRRQLNQLGGQSQFKTLWDGTGPITIGYNFDNTQYLGQADLVALHAKSGELRVVSACIKVIYTGNDLNNEGVIVGGVLPAHNFLVAGGTAPGRVISFDQFRSSAYATSFPARDGIEVRWLPTSKKDTEFQDLVSTVGFETDSEDNTEMVVLYTGVNIAASFDVEVYVNVEYIPKWGTANATAPVPFSQGAINTVKVLGNNPKALVSPGTGEGSSLMDVMTNVARGGKALGQLALGIVGDNPRMAARGGGEMMELVGGQPQALLQLGS